MTTFAEDYGSREADLEQQGETLRSDRDEAIRQAYRDGLPMEDIADVLKMSHQRVSQIVRS